MPSISSVMEPMPVMTLMPTVRFIQKMVPELYRSPMFPLW